MDTRGNNSGLGTGKWRVAVQLVNMSGFVVADNIYHYDNEADASEAAFRSCEAAEDDSVMPEGMDSTDIPGAPVGR